MSVHWVVLEVKQNSLQFITSLFLTFEIEWVLLKITLVHLKLNGFT